MQHLKYVYLLACAIALIGFSGSAIAQTTIIKGTATYVNNGSFESGSDGSPVDWLGNDTSSNLATDLGIDKAMIYRTSPAVPSNGSQYTVVGQNQSSEKFGIYLDTGYDLSVGDTFDFSYYQGEHGDLTSADIINWMLFTTTDNTDSGTVADIIASGSNNAVTTAAMSQFSNENIGSVTASSEGERLFVAFTFTLNSASQGYAGIDQVTLTTVPEPTTTAALLGIGSFFVVCWLRRKRS